LPEWQITFDLRVDISSGDLTSGAAKAEALAAVIRQVPIPPSVQAQIDALNILRAVRGTTGIEGVELSEEEVGRIISAPSAKNTLGAGREREEKEVRNAAEVMKFVAELVRGNPSAPLTEELICRIHELTTQGIEYANNVPGQYRSHPVHADRFVPPRRGEEVRRLMAEFIQWFNAGPPSAWPPAIQAIIAHFYIVSIHPFGDGNGRTARAVESFLLFRGRINARGFYSLANFYYQRRAEYVEMLDHVRFETNGDLTPFVRFALAGLVDELTSVHTVVLAEVRVIAFRDYAREQLMTSGKAATKAGERMYHLLLALADEPPVPLSALRQGRHPLSVFYRGVTAKTLSRDLNFLRTHGLVKIEGDQLRANVDIMDEFMS
jgi:Fic family protein